MMLTGSSWSISRERLMDGIIRAEQYIIQLIHARDIPACGITIDKSVPRHISLGYVGTYAKG